MYKILLKQIVQHRHHRPSAPPAPDEALRVARAAAEARVLTLLRRRARDPARRRGLVQRLRARDPRARTTPTTTSKGWASSSSRARAMPTCCSSPGRCRATWKSRCGAPTRRRPTPSSWSRSATAAAPAGSSARATRAAGAFERDPGRRRGAGLPADARCDHAGHPDRDQRRKGPLSSLAAIRNTTQRRDKATSRWSPQTASRAWLVLFQCGVLGGKAGVVGINKTYRSLARLRGRGRAIDLAAGVYVPEETASQNLSPAAPRVVLSR